MFQVLEVKNEWLQSLTPQQIDELSKSTTKATYGKNEIIVKQNAQTSHVLLLIEGIVKMHIETRVGKSIIIKLCKGGSLLGLDMHLINEPYQCSYTALAPTTIYFIDLHLFKKLINQNQPFAQLILQEIARENQFLTERIAALTYKQLPGKLADILLYLSKHIYNSNTFHLPLSRQELAEIAGTTKESLIRTLTEFKNDKIIDVQGKSISILSLSIVETLSKLG
ncbi:Crp/Fnr family transcriptional regulator [Williamwhitmania taraxaci]|uniref:CRP/FNR family transcriptional regulator, anaerobic regulatory protein n=1 Tax=Williamwhitmania taraxaci TaxID=1640674 RepID=A0A1G6Q394_9BACT|nr:Crp/Fnr family transcriptional regulator [Williamwhitmania taraxaci]SDC86236.1 CRP/FNR family transcriptional regulator, anaerobic regulatory protein [Williamwhitmania taraxaci]